MNYKNYFLKLCVLCAYVFQKKRPLYILLVTIGFELSEISSFHDKFLENLRFAAESSLLKADSSFNYLSFVFFNCAAMLLSANFPCTLQPPST
jgi:hypothetical protein